MKVIVLSSFDARFFTQPSPWIHIAITDPAPGYHHPLNRCPRKADVLRLRFSDVTPQDFESNPAFKRFEAGLFNADQAGQIIAFLDEYRNAGVDVMVNCGAGISRHRTIIPIPMCSKCCARWPPGAVRASPRWSMADRLESGERYATLEGWRRAVRRL
jgi:hypothetical protein